MNAIIDNPYVLIGVKNLKYDFIYQKDLNKQESFSSIINKIHPNWNPDFILRTFPEYCPFPEERVFDCPSIGLISDWTIMYQSVMRMAKYFNFIFVDSKGVRMIKRLGLKNVGRTQMYSFDPNVYQRLPNVKKKYDVSFVANLTHEWHPRRAHWLKRLSSLSDRYKIRIFTRKTKEEYVKILNQSKITFNFSLRSEMNMRAYEAPACGSLLFLEEENSEVRKFFTDKKHCVLYNERNFEALLKYYLSHDEERNRIIEEAYKKVQQYSYSHQFQKIIKKLEKVGLRNIKKEKARISQINRVERYHDIVICNLLHVCWLQFDYHHFKVQEYFLKQIERGFRELLNLQSNNPELLNNVGIYYAMLSIFPINKKFSVRQDRYRYQARKFILKALDYNPKYAIASFNLAQLYLHSGERKLAEEEFLKTIKILQSYYKINSFEGGLSFPLNFDSFHMQWQWTLLNYEGKSKDMQSNLCSLLYHRIYEKLGDINSAKGKSALEYYKKSLHYHPNSAVTQYKCGKTYEAIGNLKEAIRYHKKSMDSTPFYFPAWLSYVKGLYKLNKRRECRRACKEFLTILNAIPIYKNRKRPFIKILNLHKKIRIF